MKYAMAVLGGWLGALMMLSGPAVGAPADEGLARLQTFMTEVQSMQARFEQTVFDSSQQLLEEAGGQVLLARPGRFRWDYESPYERVVLADGERLWFYEADLEQVTVRRLGEALGETPAALLSGDLAVLERFEVVAGGEAGGVYRVTLQPRAADADFAAVTVAFSGSKPVELILDDRLGQRTHLQFSDIRLNVSIGKTDFRFAVPPGADVIGEDEL